LTKIEWAEEVWNPVTGCTKISPGCQNCYAERMSKRLAGRCGYPADEPFKVTLHPEKLEDPLKWKKPKRIFVCSMSDLFHEDVPDEFIFEVFNTMSNAQCFFGHKFMVLTKRPERMKQIIQMIENDIAEQRIPEVMPDGSRNIKLTFSFPLQNIWLGVTAENQEQANKRIPILLQIPAVVRFVSVEPMLGPVDLSEWMNECDSERCGLEDDPFAAFLLNEAIANGMGDAIRPIDWVICGGESGPGARPMYPDWARGLRDQCVSAGVPFFFKQFGEWMQVGECSYNVLDDAKYYNKARYKPNFQILNIEGGQGFHGRGSIYMQRVGKNNAGRLLDGKEWSEFPEVR